MPDRPNRDRPRLAAIVMAAGQGKRMQDPSKPKVLYPLAGKPMLAYVLALTEELHCDNTVVVVGYARDQVLEYIQQSFPSVTTVVQEHQLGTGHAVMQAEAVLNGYSGDVLILSGDVPLLTSATASKLVDHHRAHHALATVLTVRMPNPTGYGRILRSQNGKWLRRIVEERDADEATKMIDEINSGIYVIDSKVLFDSLKRISPLNAQGEYYLTDILPEIIAIHGESSVAIELTDRQIEVTGINTKEQLQAMETSLSSIGRA